MSDFLSTSISLLEFLNMKSGADPTQNKNIIEVLTRFWKWYNVASFTTKNVLAALVSANLIPAHYQDPNTILTLLGSIDRRTLIKYVTGFGVVFFVYFLYNTDDLSAVIGKKMDLEKFKTNVFNVLQSGKLNITKIWTYAAQMTNQLVKLTERTILESPVAAASQLKDQFTRAKNFVISSITQASEETATDIDISRLFDAPENSDETIEFYGGNLQFK